MSQIQNIINEDVDKMINTSKYKTKIIDVMVKNCDAKCPKCGSDNVNVITKQLRSADEGATNIYKCLSCGYGWRKNN